MLAYLSFGGWELWLLRLFSFGGFGLAPAAWALGPNIFGASRYPLISTVMLSTIWMSEQQDGYMISLFIKGVSIDPTARLKMY